MEGKRALVIAGYVLLLIAVVFSVDFLFLRYRFWERLTVNVGIVLLFGALYFKFLKASMT